MMLFNGVLVILMLVKLSCCLEERYRCSEESGKLCTNETLKCPPETDVECIKGSEVKPATPVNFYCLCVCKDGRYCKDFQCPDENKPYPYCSVNDHDQKTTKLDKKLINDGFCSCRSQK